MIGRALCLALALGVALPAHADDRLPGPVFVCAHMEAVFLAAAYHAGHPDMVVIGCHEAPAGQKFEIVATLPDLIQIRLFASDDTESATYWVTRLDGNRLQLQREAMK